MTNKNPIKRLAALHPWPEVRPKVSIPKVMGWGDSGAFKLAIQSIVKPDAKLVVELGVWVGRATRELVSFLPEVTVACVDHWEGSTEHKDGHKPEWTRELDRLYDKFLYLCWPHKARIVPMKMDTVSGLREIHKLELKPDVIIVDADHSYEGVKKDITTCCELFPSVTLLGDDWLFPSIRKAVHEIQALTGRRLEIVDGVSNAVANYWILWS